MIDRRIDRLPLKQCCRRRRRDTQARRVLGAPQSRTASAGDEASRRPTPVRARRAHRVRCPAWPEPPPLLLAPAWALGASLMQGSAGRGRARLVCSVFRKPPTGYEESSTVTARTPAVWPPPCSADTGGFSETARRRLVLRGGTSPEVACTPPAQPYRPVPGNG